MIRPITEQKKIDSKSEFIITLDWPDHHNADVDLWSLSPLGEAVGYLSKEAGVAALERDDMGSARDTFTDRRTDQIIYNKTNREIITLRGIIPGQWVFNVHYYASRPIPDGHISGVKSPPYADVKSIPVQVEVTVIKLNPSYKIITKKKIILTTQGEQRTMARIILDKDGNVEEILDEPFMFVTGKTRYMGGDNGP